jgi:DNA mismatch repair protein MutS2
MVRAGLPIPAASESVVPLFDEVLTDVGDDQSLQKNLSTFSAHVANLAAIIEETHVGTLVLLDELASGTDPREGEALAEAVLETLIRRGGAVACTTHYERLKLVALTDSSFENASVGFDLETMSPTFRLSFGIPGASSALAVAKRFGIPGDVIKSAESRLTRETATLSELVSRLDEERLTLEGQKNEVARERAAIERDREVLQAERERLARKEESVLGREAEALLGDVKQAREEIRAAKVRLRSGKLDPKDVAQTQKSIDQAASKAGAVDARRAGEASKERPTIAASDIVPGMRVFVPRLRTDAEVLEVLSSGQLRVAAGPLKLLTSAAEVRRAEHGQKGSPKKHHEPKRSIPFDAAADPDIPIQTSDNTVDLRGLRSHEAVAIAEQFLDRCVGAGKRVAFLVHGHGTGALRQILRDALRTSAYVSHSRPGEPREGGDGVTVVWLK